MAWLIIEVEVVWHGAMRTTWGKGSLLDAYHPRRDDVRWSQMQAARDPRHLDTRAVRSALARCRERGTRHPWTPTPRT